MADRRHGPRRPGAIKIEGRSNICFGNKIKITRDRERHRGKGREWGRAINSDAAAMTRGNESAHAVAWRRFRACGVGRQGHGQAELRWRLWGVGRVMAGLMKSVDSQWPLACLSKEKEQGNMPVLTPSWLWPVHEL